MKDNGEEKKGCQDQEGWRAKLEQGMRIFRPFDYYFYILT